MDFKPYEPHRPRTPRSKLISREEWESHRDLIEELYMRQQLTQRSVLQVLGNINFHPS